MSPEFKGNSRNRLWNVNKGRSICQIGLGASKVNLGICEHKSLLVCCAGNVLCDITSPIRAHLKHIYGYF